MSFTTQSPSKGDTPRITNDEVIVNHLRPKPSKPYAPLDEIPYTFEPIFPNPVGDNGYKFEKRSWFELTQYDELSDKEKQNLKDLASSPEMRAARSAARNAEKKKRLQELKTSGNEKQEAKAEAVAEAEAAPAPPVNAKRAKRRLREKAKKAQAAEDARATQAAQAEASAEPEEAKKDEAEKDEAKEADSAQRTGARMSPGVQSNKSLSQSPSSRSSSSIWFTPPSSPDRVTSTTSAPVEDKAVLSWRRRD